MMRALARRLRGDRRGATAAEFALALPIWLMMIFAVINLGVFYFARAGLQNGLGEAARTATLWPLRDNDAITAAFNDRVFGLISNNTPTLSYATGTSNGQSYIDITVSYNPDFYLLFIPVQPITMTYGRRAYRPS